jgi:hypothetical protein
MKKTSRRSFGKQLTGAMAGLPLVNLPRKTAGCGDDTQRNTSANSNRNEHDTPPPVIIGSGSLIFEARTESKHDWTTTAATTLGGRSALSHTFPAYDNAGQPATSNIHIAHVKIVDGSGEMVYRLDNGDKDDITITILMDKGKSEIATLRTDKKNFIITFLDTKKLDSNAGDPSMDTEDDPTKKRQRARYRDNAGNQKDIYGIEVASDKAGLLLSLKLQDHKARKELRVMSWWEV